MTRYWVETECEHGNDGICDHLPTDDFDCMRLDRDKVCPGGLRRELTGAEILEAVETSPISGHVPVRNPGRYLVVPLDEPDS